MNKFLLSCMLLFGFLANAVAQQRTVTGRVTDAGDGLPLPGVSVLATGTRNGTTTSNDGRFTIQLADGQNSLTFSYVGYQNKTVPVGSSNTVNVTLAIDAKQLGEVVVTG